MLLVTGVALVSIEFISVPFTRVLMYCHTILLSRGGLSADCRGLLLGGLAIAGENGSYLPIMVGSGRLSITLVY